MFKGKKVLITGSDGMIAQELIIQLKELGAKIYKADITIGIDLREFSHCQTLCDGKDYVFHLAGIKGSPKKTATQPVDFMEPMIQFDINMIRAAREANVKRFLYTSSIAVEHPESDYYPAWAKMTAEKVIEANRIQYPDKTKFVIVRPANVYGRFDKPKEGNMVITSLVYKSMGDSPTIEVWGDGSQIRDFINAKDCARGMIEAMKKMPKEPVNLCTGLGVSIKQIAEIIAEQTDKTIQYVPVEFTGPKSKVMNLNWDFEPKIDINAGLKEVIEHARNGWNASM
jgi:GDP-L-fucose synthase